MSNAVNKMPDYITEDTLFEQAKYSFYGSVFVTFIFLIVQIGYCINYLDENIPIDTDNIFIKYKKRIYNSLFILTSILFLIYSYYKKNDRSYINGFLPPNRRFWEEDLNIYKN